MNKTIGVAICCYKGHIPHLKNLFDSIEQQYKKPDQVIVSCSSSYIEDIPYQPRDYSFHLLIIVTHEKKNAAENRNIAASHLTTDIISFFDADDIMHPQRLLFIYECFVKYDIKLFAHNTISDPDQSFEIYPTYFCLRNVLYRCPYGSTKIAHHLPDAMVHNAHISITRDVFDAIKYPEHPFFHGKEDTVYCTAVILTYPQNTVYCHNALSKYVPSRTMESF